MGANLLSTTFPGDLDVYAVSAKYAELYRHAALMNGADPYGGSWNTCEPGLQVVRDAAGAVAEFGSVQAACEHLDGVLHKGAMARAVRARVTRTVVVRTATFRAGGVTNHGPFKALVTVRAAAGGWEPVPADGLPACLRRRLLAAYARWADRARLESAARAAWNLQLAHLADLDREAPPARPLARARSAAARTRAAVQRAEAALRALDDEAWALAHAVRADPEPPVWVVACLARS